MVMMHNYKFRFWVGPSQVEQIADKLTEAGIEVTCVGTEHLHVVSEGTSIADARMALFELMTVLDEQTAEHYAFGAQFMHTVELVGVQI